MKQKLIVLAVVAILIGLAIAFDLGHYLSLDYFRSQREAIQSYTSTHPWLSAFFYWLVYVVTTGLSLPGAAVLTLAGGALFGLWTGTLLVSLSSTMGATLAFLVSRLLLRDWVQSRFGDSLRKVNAGVEREGAFYLFGLRLVPLFPFVVVNLVMGLTPMKTWRYFWVSQLGMLPGTLVYVYAGTQLGEVDSLRDVGSPGLIFAFVLLGIFPLLAKRTMNWIQARKAYAGFTKPHQFDNNLIVIGAGSAGLVTSYIAAAVKAKVTLIEKHKMGGDCLNTGCVPSKALLRSAKIAQYLRRAEEFGIKRVEPEVDFTAVMARIQNVISQVEPHDSVERYTQLGVRCIQGEAKILDPWRVQVNGQVISARNLVIATGARPQVPNIPGLQQIPYYTSDSIWSLRQRPQRLLVLGGGPIGCELAQGFRRLGIDVVQVVRGDHLMPKEDPEVAEIIADRFRQEGIDLRLNHKPQEFQVTDEGYSLLCEHQGETRSVGFDTLLLALGRKANTEGLGLEQLPLGCNPDGTVRVNERLQTEVPNIHACGDVAGPYQFTHTAAHQAWYASVNSLFSGLKSFAVDYRVIPWCTFTDPEFARVGLSEQEAQEQGIGYEVTRYGIDDLDRAIAEGENHGFVKVLTAPGKDRILGVTLVGHHAGELIAEYVTAMKHGLGLNKILGTIHIYPTLTEANKYAAGEWKRAHAPAAILRALERFHRWRRGEAGATGAEQSKESANEAERKL